ncbi:ribonuclease H-like domain-containing protein [Schizothecium vesticola]|uniref:ribonuclease H n=1 Tax=Schizothecium vesticola TaxID=314040 RepID=A0AA40BP38_9PEZI|nr:ribonuclease H-like domain-containing protein [Schizothecium vesticola]
MRAYYRPNTASPQRTPTDYWDLSTATPQPVFPDTFDAGYEPPLDLIRPLDCGPAYGLRLVHREAPWWAFVFVDGACTNNGQLGAQGGWAVVYGPPTETDPPHVVSGRLEEKGPLGGPDVEPTSNRAELRASIAALRLGHWRGDGFQRLVIATDSAYVVDGATSWSRNWVCNGWRNFDGAPVKNRDLWELLLGQKIPRELNQEADSAAKAASLRGFREPEFMDWVIREP